MIKVMDESDIEVSPYEALSILQEQTNMFGVFINIDRVAEIQSMTFECRKPFLTLWRAMAGDPELNVTQTRALPDIYMRRFGVSIDDLRNFDGSVGTGEPILNALLEKKNVSDDAKLFAKLQLAIREYTAYLTNLKQYLSLPLCEDTDKYGNRMVMARPTYTILSTSRLQANSPSIQNINRGFADIITEPKNFTLLRTDSGQIEPRIMYSHFIKDDLIKHLILLYNDAYYGLLHYILLSPKEELRQREVLKQVEMGHRGSPVLVLQEVKIKALDRMELTRDMRNALKLAGLAAGYGSNLEGRDVPYAREYVEKINNHPGRKKWQAEVERFVDAGGDTFYTPFGLAIKPEETDKYKPGTMAWRNHVIRCGINNPIQATASQLMCQSVWEAYKIIRQTRSKIAYYKHDEGAFYIHDTEVENLSPSLSGVTAYQVKDWIPIEAEAELGVKKSNGFGVEYTDESISKEIERMKVKYNVA